MDGNIQIIEKPEWVSWDDIKQCLVEAHSVNRAKGIIMSHYQWPAEKIKESLGNNGVVLVALDGNKLVGTAAISEKFGAQWYAKGRYAYMCFAGVNPEYSGKGIYSSLTEKREVIAREKGFKVFALDTHEDNLKIQKIAIKNGYRYVRFLQAASKDHFSVVMVKWPDGSPYSKFYCWWKFQISRVKTLTKARLLPSAN